MTDNRSKAQRKPRIGDAVLVRFGVPMGYGTLGRGTARGWFKLILRPESSVGSGLALDIQESSIVTILE